MFIGANSAMFYGVYIDPNVIVTRESVVTNDVLSGSIVGEVFAKVITALQMWCKSVWEK